MDDSSRINPPCTPLRCLVNLVLCVESRPLTRFCAQSLSSASLFHAMRLAPTPKPILRRSCTSAQLLAQNIGRWKFLNFYVTSQILGVYHALPYRTYVRTSYLCTLSLFMLAPSCLCLHIHLIITIIFDLTHTHEKQKNSSTST